MREYAREATDNTGDTALMSALVDRVAIDGVTQGRTVTVGVNPVKGLIHGEEDISPEKVSELSLSDSSRVLVTDLTGECFRSVSAPVSLIGLHSIRLVAYQAQS